jgi:tricorn protease
MRRSSAVRSCVHLPPAALLFASSLAVAPVAQAQTPAQTQSQTRMLRSPSVSATDIAFAYANNIWIVPRAGGTARRLTSFGGQTQNPYLSPDGKWVAFSAEYSGNSNVYVVPAEGGQPRRLTWHPGADLVQGWTPDGARIVFASGRDNAPTGAPRFFTVPREGGVEQPMPMPRAYQGKISPDGKRVAYRMNNSWDEERRDYRGGQNRPIWILDLATMDVESPPWTDSKDIDPVWIGDVVYFLSDRDGVSNVWAYDTHAKTLKQMTKLTGLDVKTLDAGGGVLVFEEAGYVHELDPASGREHIVNITAAGDFPWMMAEWKDVTKQMSALALSETGQRAAVEARGDIFTIPAKKGDVRNLTNSSSSAEHLPAWSPDGRFVSYFSDASGEYQLVIAPQDGMGKPRTIALPEHGQYYTPSWSPDGKHIVFHDTDLKLWVLDVASGKASVIDHDSWMAPVRSLDPVWSPDSKWVAYAKRLPTYFHAIFVHNIETGATEQITNGFADATSPAWDESGKYLWFLASTSFGLNSAWLDMSQFDHPQTRALYLAVLAKNEPSPVLPESDEERAARETRPPGGDTARVHTDSVARRAADTSEVRLRPSTQMHIDFDGLQQRIISIPGIAMRDYGELRSGPAGTVFFVEAIPPTGTAEDSAKGGTLHRYQLKDRKAIPFAQNVQDYVVSGNGSQLLYQTGGPRGGLFLVPTDKEPPPPSAGAAAAMPQGKLAAQLRAFVDPKAEFKQMFDEAWRIERDYLYVKNMQGSDWNKVKEQYGALLPFVAHRSDLTYLLDEMQAEIAVGHSFVRGGDMPPVPTSTIGMLGADFAVQDGRYRITKIYNGESWNPDIRAPLSAPGVDVHTGDYVLAVNGAELRAPDDIFRLLDGTADRQTVITVNSKPVMAGARTITVIPVSTERGLRARAWIEHNRHVVDSLSHGQLAYVYLPNTATGGYTSFNRDFFAQQDRKGVILDERYNSGGFIADYIIDFLQRNYDGYFNNAAGNHELSTSPIAGIWGPKVMLINEMAGSGGDAMPYMFKSRKVGLLVGKRTWGGLVGIWDAPTLADGGSITAPRGGFISRDGKWAVENEGVAPDVDVEDFPKEMIAGHDAQLERGVQEALRMLKEHPVNTLAHEPPPPTWGKRAVPLP